MLPCQTEGYAGLLSEEPSSSPPLPPPTHAQSDRVGFGVACDDPAQFVVEEVPSHHLVPGDVVTLAAGSLIPADLRLISTSQLLINQTILTGESIPAEKNTRIYRPHDASKDGEDELAGHTDSHFLRRPCLAFNGSVVESGSGVGVVLSTGSYSYFGANASELQQARPPSAFAKGVKQVTVAIASLQVRQHTRVACTHSKLPATRTLNRTHAILQLQRSRDEAAHLE